MAVETQYFASLTMQSGGDNRYLQGGRRKILRLLCLSIAIKIDNLGYLSEKE